jgi:hypothetical protein
MGARTFGQFNRAFEAGIMAYGPWSPGCRGHDERKAQLRSLAALAAVYLGSDHSLVDVLRAAESDPMAFIAAEDAIARVPSLTRRRILSTFSAITFRTPRRPDAGQ